MPRAYIDIILSSKLRKAALILGNQLRIEAAGTVARHVDVDLASIGNHGLAAIAIAAVACLIVAAQMIIHLGTQRAFGQRLLQRIKQSALIQCSSSIRASQKTIQ
jgi:hypothetical protein